MSLTLLAAGLLVVGIPLPVLAPPPHTGVQGSVYYQTPAVFIQLPDGTWVGLPLSYFPVDTTITVFNARTGRLVTRVAAQVGRFSVSLPPGTYSLVPDPLPSSSPNPPLVNTAEVTVRPRQFTPVSFTYYHPIIYPPGFSASPGR